jgi:hypothetical protein
MKYIITESQELSLKNKLKNKLNNFGIEITSKIVGGKDNLFKLLNIESPMDFLHLFDDLNVVESEEDPNWTLFRYKPKENLMTYDRKHNIIYISFKIWTILSITFKLEYSEIQQLTERWLSEEYDLRGVETKYSNSLSHLQV